MINIDKIPKSEVHLLIALRRKKDNIGTLYSEPKHCREIIYDEEVDMKNLINRCEAMKGTWRIHKTVNTRCVHSAMKLLRHKQIEEPDYVAMNLSSCWKTALMNNKSKKTRRFLIDIDDMELAPEIKQYFLQKNIPILQENKSPKGYHIVVDKFDTRDIKEKFQGRDFEIKRDDYIYIKTVSFW